MAVANISTGKPKGGGFFGFMEKIAPFIPVVGGIASNILGGINERKARLYNSPAEQIKRLREAGLPSAAGSQISGGTGSAPQPQSLGTENFNNNLSQSITRQIDRKRLEILDQELRAATADADIKEGDRNNQLNPAGKFEPTNQGTGHMQTLSSQAEAVKAAQIVNKWMPTEKYQNVMKQGKEIESISANIQNSLAQNRILLADGKIKNIVANYQERMSLAELTNLIRRNTGISLENQLKTIAINVEYQTQFAKIMTAKNLAEQSGAQLEAAHLGNILTNLSLPSTRAYYQIRRHADDIHVKNPNLVKDIIYLGMFQPNTSNYNLNNLGGLMPSFNLRGGNTFNTYELLKQ